jgi:hypothetical protein
MAAQFEDLSVTPAHRPSGLPAAGLSLLALVLYLLRGAVFAVLATLEPLVRVGCSLLAILGLVTCLLFKGLFHAPHFPLGLMLLFSVSMAVLAVLYGLIVEWLAP